MSEKTSLEQQWQQAVAQFKIVIDLVMDDLIRSYDEVVTHLIFYYLHDVGEDKKKHEKAISLPTIL